MIFVVGNNARCSLQVSASRLCCCFFIPGRGRLLEVGARSQCAACWHKQPVEAQELTCYVALSGCAGGLDALDFLQRLLQGASGSRPHARVRFRVQALSSWTNEEGRRTT